MRTLAFAAFAGAVLATAAVPASAAQIVENFTISVSGSANQDFLGTPFALFDPSIGTLTAVAETITGSLTWLPTDPRDQLLLVSEESTRGQFFFASQTGGPQVIHVNLMGIGSISRFEGPGTRQDTLLGLLSDGTLSGAPLSGKFTYTYTPSSAPVPEPSTWAMMALGFAVLAMRRCGARAAFGRPEELGSSGGASIRRVARLSNRPAGKPAPRKYGARTMTSGRASRNSVLAMVLTGGVIAAPSAQAAFVATFQEIGSNVFEMGSGDIDLTALKRTGGIVTKLFVTPSEPAYAGGAAGVFGDIYEGALSGPANWGTGGNTYTKISTGDLVALVPSGAEIVVPDDYESGGALSQTSTYLDASFSSLGLTPGEYIYSWGSGADFDTYTINVGVVPPPLPVPEPSTWAMMMIGFVGLGYAGYRTAEAGKAANAIG